MGTVAHYVEVKVRAEQAYAWWRGLTNLPKIMPDVESVQTKGDLTHWKVQGPLGKTVEWDAKIVEDVPAEKISWTSTDGDVANSGTVRFDDHGDSTGVGVSLEYEPPMGTVGATVAQLFADPQVKVEQALAVFKETLEGVADAR